MSAATLLLKHRALVALVALAVLVSIAALRGASTSESEIVEIAEIVGAAAAAPVPQCCSQRPCFDCDSVVQLLAQTRNASAFGRGFYKQAHVVVDGVSGRSFVVKTAHSDSAAYVRERWASKNNGELLSDDDVAARLRAKFASECEQMLAWHSLAVPVAPHVHGGCYEVGREVVSVVEQLRTIADVTFDSGVPLLARVVLAANAMRVVQAWDALAPFNHSRADTDVISSIKEYRVTDATALIYGDFDPKQFAVDGEWRLRLVDIDAREWVPYAPQRGNFAADVACASDGECQAVIAQFGIDRRLEKGKRPLPHEFGCDAARGRCHGLSGKTNVFAACAILLVPLLETFFSAAGDPHAHWQPRITTILAHCTAQQPAQRWSAVQVEEAFRQLAAEASPPPPLRLAPALSGEELEERIMDIRKSIKKQRVSVV